MVRLLLRIPLRVSRFQRTWVPGNRTHHLADMVAQARTATQATSTDTTPVEFIPGSSTAQSSSCTAPLPTLVPLSRVQKLEAQMATLLHHIHPWMQKSITESEERLERKMVQFTERKIAEVN